MAVRPRGAPALDDDRAVSGEIAMPAVICLRTRSRGRSPRSPCADGCHGHRGTSRVRGLLLAGLACRELGPARANQAAERALARRGYRLVCGRMTVPELAAAAAE